MYTNDTNKTNVKRISKIRIIGTISIFVSLLPFLAYGATEIWPEISATTTNTAKVVIHLVTDEPVNALELEVELAQGLRIVRFDDGRSDLDVFQTYPPTVTNNRFRLAGGSFEPLTGEHEIISFFVEGNAAENGIKILQASAYAADGEGTSLPIVIGGTKTGAVAGSGAEIIAADRTPPEFRNLFLVRDPFAAGRKLVAFRAEDGGSGVARAEMRVRRWFAWGEWQAAASPSVLPAGAWSAAIRIYDNADNLVENTIYNWSAPLPIIIFLVFLLLVAGLVINRARKR